MFSMVSLVFSMVIDQSLFLDHKIQIYGILHSLASFGPSAVSVYHKINEIAFSNLQKCFAFLT